MLARIEAALLADPSVEKVWRAADVLPGPERAALPDLVFATHPEVQVFAERGSAVTGAYDPSVADHDIFGIFVAAGPALARTELAQRPRLVDVAPLALQLLDLPVPAEMHGEFPAGLLADGRSPARVPEASFAATAPPRTGAVYTPEEIEALEKSLRALGYGN